MLTVYSKVNCKYCEAIETVFSVLKNIRVYEELLLNVDYTREEFIE